MLEICEEMKKFRKYLDDKGIDWDDFSDDYTCRTRFEVSGTTVSVINAPFSYGGINGLLEAMFWGKNQSEPVGFLTHVTLIRILKKEMKILK